MRLRHVVSLLALLSGLPLALLLAGCTSHAPAMGGAMPAAVTPSVPRDVSAPADDCPIPGEMAHWQADYCMAQVGTDDIIAAGPCLERESAVRFRSACSAKQHYKAGLCEQVIANGARRGSVEACVADPEFAGRTVRDGGA